MRKQNTKTTVPLDVVPERRTKRFPPRFGPVGRFCELRFRYLSSPTGREGEISRPLDHMRQIPFIYWYKIDGVYACALLKISNSPFYVIPFHSRLFLLVFLGPFSGFEANIYIFSFVTLCSSIQLYRE